jgi:hypothetical protein
MIFSVENATMRYWLPSRRMPYLGISSRDFLGGAGRDFTTTFGGVYVTSVSATTALAWAMLVTRRLVDTELQGAVEVVAEEAMMKVIR